MGPSIGLDQMSPLITSSKRTAPTAEGVMSEAAEDGVGSPQLSLSGCSSLFSVSTTGGGSRLHLLPPRLSLSVGVVHEPEPEPEEEELELDLQVGVSSSSSGRNNSKKQQPSENLNLSKDIRMMRNRESALRSRARKRAYVQELEKEVRRLVDDNLKLKRQCRQLKTEMAALIQFQPAAAKTSSESLKRTSSTLF